MGDRGRRRGPRRGAQCVRFRRQASADGGSGRRLESRPRRGGDSLRNAAAGLPAAGPLHSRGRLPGDSVAGRHGARVRVRRPPRQAAGRAPPAHVRPRLRADDGLRRPAPRERLRRPARLGPAENRRDDVRGVPELREVPAVPVLPPHDARASPPHARPPRPRAGPRRAFPRGLRARPDVLLRRAPARPFTPRGRRRGGAVGRALGAPRALGGVPVAGVHRPAASRLRRRPSGACTRCGSPSSSRSTSPASATGTSRAAAARPGRATSRRSVQPAFETGRSVRKKPRTSAEATCAR